MFTSAGHPADEGTIIPKALDWGCTGEQIVLLTGLHHTARVFAPKLLDCCRVHGLTWLRRRVQSSGARVRRPSPGRCVLRRCRGPRA
jgi:hypothetical protein